MRGRHLVVVGDGCFLKIPFGLVQGGQLLVVLVQAHAAGAVAILVGQVQALLVHAISDAVLLFLQPALTVAEPQAIGGALPLQPQRCDLLVKSVGVGLYCPSLLGQPALLIHRQH
ncbi:hypothetical protein D3C80_1615110 [compost metagenome]